MCRTFLFALFLFAACGGQVTGGDGTTGDSGAAGDSGGSCFIHASSYDQSCSTDLDCIGVFDGDACTATCHCSNATINRSALVKYEADFPRTDGGVACPCPAGLVTCQNHVCAPCNDPSCFQGADGGVRH
jgi:hypothetical protein